MQYYNPFSRDITENNLQAMCGWAVQNPSRIWQSLSIKVKISRETIKGSLLASIWGACLTGHAPWIGSLQCQLGALVESWYPFWTRSTSSLETPRLPEQCPPTHQHLPHAWYPDCRGHLRDNLLSFWVAGAGLISSPTGSQENADYSPSLLASQMPDPGPTPQIPLSPRSTLCVLKLSPDSKPWPPVLLQSP